jgi:hypothetical protein
MLVSAPTAISPASRQLDRRQRRLNEAASSVHLILDALIFED